MGMRCQKYRAISLSKGLSAYSVRGILKLHTVQMILSFTSSLSPHETHARGETVSNSLSQKLIIRYAVCIVNTLPDNVYLETAAQGKPYQLHVTLVFVFGLY